MRITRRALDINSLAYSREFDVKRSHGFHLMGLVDYIAKASGIEKEYSVKKSRSQLDPYATVGFLWEHVMIRAEKIEHALSVEALRMEMIHRTSLTFPGEQFWCYQCDRFMRGGRMARKHCRRTGHAGVFSTPDAYDTVDNAYVEFKATWKSSKRSKPAILHSQRGIWRWGIQCGWNCMSLGTKTARLIALHINGDYSPGLPTPDVYEITYEFTAKDLRRIKAIVKGGYDAMVKMEVGRKLRTGMED